MKETEQPILIRGGTLVDGTGGSPRERTAILVEDGRIAGIHGEDFAPGRTCRTIDATGMTVLPGLIDMHLHFRCGPSDRLRLGAGDVPSHIDMSVPMITLKAMERARRTLEMGFTTVRDVGDVANIAVAMRDAIAMGLAAGPRIAASGPNYTVTGGSGDYVPDWLVRTDVESRVISGIEGCREAVRRNLKNKTDWIKFFATGTFGDGGEQDFTDAEMAVMVEEAHRRGKRVCAHACFEQGTLAAVRAGVDTIEHGSRLDAGIIEEMLKRGTVLVPTIYIFQAIVDNGRATGMKASAISAAEALLETHVESFRLAMRSGVAIATGSDCGNAVTRHGTNATELELMVRYGMSEMDAIVASTRSAARALGFEDMIGTVEKGKLADIVLVAGDPLKNIALLKDRGNIRYVLQSGRVAAMAPVQGTSSR
jgi:imidazolonepropionase-like amidohydrolase